MSSFLTVAYAPRLGTCNSEGLHLPHIYIPANGQRLKIDAGKALAQYLFHTTARD